MIVIARANSGGAKILKRNGNFSGGDPVRPTSILNSSLQSLRYVLVFFVCRTFSIVCSLADMFGQHGARVPGACRAV